jgi:hypothetical protein
MTILKFAASSSMLALSAALIFSTGPAPAQGTGGSFDTGGGSSGGFMPQIPVGIPTPVMPQIPVNIAIPRTPTIPLVPTDYTNVGMTGVLNVPGPMGPQEGVTSTGFSEDVPKQDGQGILVRALNHAKYDRPSLESVTLHEGSILVSVRRPSRLGLITTPQGVVSVAADSDVIVSYHEGIVRVLNLTGMNESVKMKVHHEMVQAKVVTGTDSGQSAPAADPPKPLALAIKVGNELIVGDRPLVKADLRPADGIGRRRFCLLESNYLAVNEFSLETVLTTSDMMVDLVQKVDGLKERRLIGDLSKMAAVLNYLNGAGYQVEKAK